MDNQHRAIKGYRELSQEEIDVMNTIKIKSSEVGALVNSILANTEADKRWVAIAQTNLQQGFMALTRAIAKPEFF